MLNHNLLDRPEPREPLPQLLDARGVAELLGVSLSTVERLTRAGALPSVRILSARRYRADAIREWVRSREEGGVA